MNMKPFDLTKALAGEPVVMRNGTKIKKVYLLDCIPEELRRIVAVLERNEPWLYYNGGRLDSDCDYNSQFDLFMLDEPKTYWVNVYLLNMTKKEIITGATYGTKQEALQQRSKDGSYIKTISFEV